MAFASEHARIIAKRGYPCGARFGQEGRDLFLTFDQFIDGNGLKQVLVKTD